MKRNPTLRELYKRWTTRALHLYLGTSRSRKTKSAYKTALDRFAKFLDREATLSDLNVTTYKSFMRWMEEQGLTYHLRQDTRLRVRGLWRIAIRAGLIDGRKPLPKRNPTANMPLWERTEAPEGSLRWFYATWYFPLRIRGRSKCTDALYKYTIRVFGRFLGREPMLDDLSDLSLSNHLAAQTERGISPHSVVKEYDQLVALWRGACKKNLLREWPTLQRPQAPECTPKAWTRVDLEKLFAACAAAPGMVGEILAADYWTALHLVLWYCAERISAVRALCWSDVDLETGWLTIPAMVRKGRKRDRTHRLPAEATEALRKIVMPERRLIFEWPGDRLGIYGRYDVILKSAGLPTDFKSKFHRMRRSVASHYESLGGNATALLDHSSRRVTEKYLDPRIVKPPQAADLLFPPRATGGAA